MISEVFILTPEPPDRPGGVERFVSIFMSLAQEHGYNVRVFHRENCAPARWKSPCPSNKVAWFLAGLLQGYYIGKAAQQGLHPAVQLVLSNSTIGWFPLGDKVKQVHFYHGTYRGQAEAIRPFITQRGYLKMVGLYGLGAVEWEGKASSLQFRPNSGRSKEVLSHPRHNDLVSVRYKTFLSYRPSKMSPRIRVSREPSRRVICRKHSTSKGFYNYFISLFVLSTRFNGF